MVLPLLMVVTVGIYDFGAAFTVKEKLVTITQTGARFGASQPGNDLSETSVGCPQLDRGLRGPRCGRSRTCWTRG